ncbi:hypothetical protein P7C71_g5786, partial [Lecanoromycetidae sp. Uapishka_2]
MSKFHSNDQTASLPTTATKLSLSSPSSPEGPSESPTQNHATPTNRPDAQTRRAIFKDKCNAMRASELASDTASQQSASSEFSDDEETLCEGSHASIERLQPVPDSAATKVQKTKSSRGCMSRNFGNVYYTGRADGRKILGTASGAPNGCLPM